MKIEQRGFNIIEISERVAGIDGEGGDARIAFVLADGGELTSPWLRPGDVKALIEALTAAHGLMDSEQGEVVALIDRDGDRWGKVARDKFTHPLFGRQSRAWVERELGPVIEVRE